MAELTSGTSDQLGTPREGSAHDPAAASSPQGVGTAQLRLVDLDKTYPGGHHALRGVSLDVADGEVVVIIGPSGCGKSTLLRTINGLEPINSGQIILDGTDLAAPGVSWPEVRRRIGMVFQSYELFPHLTVMGNLTLAPGLVAGESRGDASARALKLLERVGLADRADDYPRQLSGGQRQRVAIVRALMMDPEILLLDEVTASLDPEMVREVLDVVLELARTGMTMLIVTHEMGFARAIADRIVFMDEGRIVEVDEAQLRVGGQFCHVFSMWRERSEMGQQMRKYSTKIRP